MSDNKKYTFTTMDILEEVKVLAKSKPDYVYLAPDPDQFCSYVGGTDGTGEGHGCIVGQALMRHGVSMEDLVEVEGTYAGHAVMVLLGLDPGTPVMGGRGARDFLNAVQMFQDEGCQWGEALEEALELHPEFA